MIADRARLDAYAQALRAAVRPGMTVADIGTGATGIWALLACRAGARKVYAIDPNPAIQVAREIARANGFSDRIEFIQDLSTRVSLPESADVIVFEIHGVLPMFGESLASIVDARQRFLAPGGVLIPGSESLHAALVEAEEFYAEQVSPWENLCCGLDLKAGRRYIVNSEFKYHPPPEQLLSLPQQWTTLDYATLESTRVSGEFTWEALRAGTAHGLLVWFDCHLADGIGFSCGPGHPETIFGSGFLPFSQPLSLSPGDRGSVILDAAPVGGDYLWAWTVRTQDKRGLDLRHSHFYRALLPTELLRKRAATHIPQLNEEGAVTLFVLSLMTGQRSQGEIASAVVKRFPERFADRQSALHLVTDIAERYSR
jgi:protein arginine N-methyltransferase 1